MTVLTLSFVKLRCVLKDLFVKEKRFLLFCVTVHIVCVLQDTYRLQLQASRDIDRDSGYVDLSRLT